MLNLIFFCKAPECRVKMTQCSSAWLDSARSCGSVSQHSLQQMKLSNYHLVLIKLEIREKEHFNNLLAGATLLKTDFKNSAILFSWPFFFKVFSWQSGNKTANSHYEPHAAASRCNVMQTAAEHFICIKAHRISVFNKEINGLWFVFSICKGN